MDVRHPAQGIKYYDRIETDIKEPPEVKEGMFLDKIKGIFSEEEGESFTEALMNEPIQITIPSFNDRGAMERNTYLEKDFVYYKITFDEHGKVDRTKFENNINPYERFSTTVQKGIFKILKRLGREFKWENSVKLISCIGTEYLINREIENPLNDCTWHSDPGTYRYYKYTAELTTIMLLSDPDNAVSGWKGGKLSYTAPSSPRSTQPDPNWPIWSIKPTYLDAISFGNFGMLHKVGKITPRIEGCGNRIIFTMTALDYNSKETRKYKY